MTQRDKSLMKSLTLGICAVSICICIGILLMRQTKTIAVQPEDEVPLLPVPTATPIMKPVVQETSVTGTNSARGDKRLELRATKNPDGTTHYAFFVTDVSGKGERLLLEKTLGPSASMAVPYNSWNPTDTYVFLEETVSGEKKYSVVPLSGGPILDVNAVWKEKQMPYRITEATGWASESLLILYTAKDDGTKGPHYWFEVPSTAILLLSS